MLLESNNFFYFNVSWIYLSDFEINENFLGYLVFWEDMIGE